MMTKRLFSWNLLLALLIAVLVIYFYRSLIAAPGQALIDERIKKTETAAATLLFVGDVMVHDTQFEAAYLPDRDRYDFNPCFAMIKPLVAGADLAVVNLETTLAGEDQGYTGYPAFNTPESLADALKEAGFDLVSTANNHSLDRGEYGVLKTLDHLEAAGLKTFGTYRSRAARERPLLVDINGISAAFMAYTYGTNGIPLPENKEYLVNLLDPDLIIADIHRVRDQADLVILYLHWGLEYHREPTAEQRKLATRLFEEGADIIIGNHPHVVQPLEFIKFSYRGELKEGVVAYSLGNCTGDQIDPYTDTGIMVFVQVVKELSPGKVDIIEVTYVPTWIQRYYRDGRRDFRVLPILPDAEYWQQLTADPYVTADVLQKIQQVQSEMDEHLHYLPQGLPADYNTR